MLANESALKYMHVMSMKNAIPWVGEYRRLLLGRSTHLSAVHAREQCTLEGSTHLSAVHAIGQYTPGTLALDNIR